MCISYNTQRISINLFVGMNQGFLSTFDAIILPAFPGSWIILVDKYQIATICVDLRRDLSVSSWVKQQLSSISPIPLSTALYGFNEELFQYKYLCGIVINF